jgi:small subunit ribosomal protein S6|tara:strand:+ start:338 stop:694 length:357 start_codon:yes stop_codon:yes gene_type:complete
MNLYEHTIIARQDTSPAELKQLKEKYSKIVEKNDGEIVKTENWGLLNLSYLIKKNRKGSYIHFKIKGSGNLIEQLEKNEAIDKKLIRFLTVKVKKFDLDTNYFAKKEESEKTLKKEKN